MSAPMSDSALALVQEIRTRAQAAGVPVDHFDDFPDTDALFAKIVKHAGSFAFENPFPDAVFVDALQGLGGELGRRERKLAPHYTRLASMSRDLNLARQKFNDAVAQIAQTHLSSIAAGVSPADLKDSLDKSMKHYEKERAKKSTKGFTDRKQAALETQQKVLQNTTCDYLINMQTVREKREFEFSKQLLALYRAQANFLDEGARTLKDVVSLGEQMLAVVAAEKERLDTGKPVLTQLKQEAERAVFASERVEKELERLEKEGKSTSGVRPVPKPPSAPSASGPPATAAPPPPGAPARRSEDVASFASGPTPDGGRGDCAAFLEDIFSTPGNEACADCGKERPRWGACDIGALLCDDCVQIHREPQNALKGDFRLLGMQTHTAQLISLEAADSEVARLLMLKAVGNSNLNSVLEARLQSGPMAALRYKPTATSSVEEKRAFIGKKYDLREYMIRPDRQLSLLTIIRGGGVSRAGGAPIALLGELLAGANVAAPDAIEALHMAVAEGDTLAVDMLIRNGCSANQPLRAYTPLHLAAQMDRVDVAKLLLLHGASAAATDATGKTPLDIARASQSAGMARLLSQLADGDSSGLREPIYVSLWSRMDRTTGGGSPNSQRSRRSDHIYAQIDDLGKSKPNSIASLDAAGRALPARKAPPPPARAAPPPPADAEPAAITRSPRSSRANIMANAAVVPSAGIVAPPPPQGNTVPHAPAPAPPTEPATPVARSRSGSSSTMAGALAAAPPAGPVPPPTVMRRQTASGSFAPTDPPPFTEAPPPVPPATPASSTAAHAAHAAPVATPGPAGSTPARVMTRPMIFIPPPPSAPATSAPPAAGPPPSAPSAVPPAVTVTVHPAAPTIVPPSGPPPNGPPSTAPPKGPASGAPPFAPPAAPTFAPPSVPHDDMPPFSPPKPPGPPVSPRMARAPPPTKPRPTAAPVEVPALPDNLPAPPLALVNPDVNLRNLDDEIDA